MITSLKHIGKLVASYQRDIAKPIAREVGIKIRQNINPHRICDWCLSDHKHQTKGGDKLCKSCYDDYCYTKATREM
jgi:hypothetical protein